MSGAARRLAAAALAAALLAALVVAPAAAGSKKPKLPRVAPAAPAADSVTLALWHFDENGGTLAADAGPGRLDGTAGIDTRTDFGRFHGARLFSNSVDSWVIVPYAPKLEARSGFTVEAWVRIDSVATYELQVIAARWTPIANQQGWVFGVTGGNLAPPDVPVASPGWFTNVIGFAPAQRLVFGYQPALAGPVRGCTSTTDLPLGRWVHVAASLDGEVVRLYIDGRLDSSFETKGMIRPTEAPLLVGSVFDPRHLTSFGSDLRMDPNANETAYYPFIGAIDELRLSGAVRSAFESAPRR